MRKSAVPTMCLIPTNNNKFSKFNTTKRITVCEIIFPSTSRFLYLISPVSNHFTMQAIIIGLIRQSQRDFLIGEILCTSFSILVIYKAVMFVLYADYDPGANKQQPYLA